MSMGFLSVFVLTVGFGAGVQGAVGGKYMAPAGCFLSEEAGEKDLPFRASLPSYGTNVEACVDYCRDLFYKVAGLQRGDCYCGSMFGQFGPAECKTTCEGNNKQICGGSGANSVFFTGHNAPGPVTGITSGRPSDNKTLDRDDTLHLKWNPPEIKNGKITGYKIQLLNVVTSYSKFAFRPAIWDIDASSAEADLTGVKPGVQYNVSMVAINEFGPGPPVYASVWSRVGKPPIPPFPKLTAKSGGQMTVELTPVEPTTGPITSYRIVVIDESSPVIFKPELLADFDSAQEQGTPYYIAAEISGVYLPKTFVVGNSRRYGNYWNKVLPSGRDFHVILGVLSTLNGETRASYARPGHEQHEDFHGGDDHDHDHGHGHSHDYVDDDDHEGTKGKSGGVSFISGKWTPVTIVLASGIVIFGALLVASIVGYFVLRRRIHLRRRRRRGATNMKRRSRPSDQQELTVSVSQLVHPQEPMDAAYVSSVFLVEDDIDGGDGRGLRGVEKYEKLKRKIWNIPPTAIGINPEVLGKGKFGLVKHASLTKKGLTFDGAVHSLEDARISDSQKRSMLQDLDLCIRMGSHMNLVHLIGICEEPETIHVVVEYFPTSLKQYLLESRLDRNGYADRGQTISAAGAPHLLEVAVGIAMGMSHLASMQITHKQLCAKTVSLVERSVPKIGGIGYSNYNSLAQAPDFTRWLPFEALKSSHYSFFPAKGDVWSFGVLLWEIATLGATPYGDIRSNDELTMRVLKGTRLPQTVTIEDELYRLIESCWEVDSAERPTFHSLQAQLRTMAQQRSLPQINFSRVGENFDYEPYYPELEHISS